MVVKTRRNTKNPPVLSHEFIIQNHADIVACVAMVFVVGLIFQVTAPVASLFITVHHNTTRNYTAPYPYEEETLFTAGWKDSCAVFFYTMIAIVLHALVQEYVLDKVTRKLHLSKIRHAKFNDAGQRLAFAVVTAMWGANIVMSQNYLTNISKLWEGFPHSEMNFVLKLFWLFQISYCLHWVPETYFLRMKKDEANEKLTSAAIHLGFVFCAYLTSLTRIGTVLLVLHSIPEIFLNLGKLLVYAEKENASRWVFRSGNFLFLLARFLSFTFAVLTFWYGMESHPAQGLRMLALGVIGGLQLYLLFQFSIFQVKRLRGAAAAQTSAPKSPKKTSKKAPKEKDVSDLPEVDQNTRKQAQSKKVKAK